MWSDRYYYLNIFHDAELSVYFNTAALIEFLKTLPELKQTDNFTFSNSPEFPMHISLILLCARSLNSWNDGDTDPLRTNLIAIVCTKDKVRGFEQLKNIFIKIASYVNWQLVDELTDDDVEDEVIWAPEGKI